MCCPSSALPTPKKLHRALPCPGPRPQTPNAPPLRKSTPSKGVYDLFMLPHQPGVRALVIGIANSIDLTERALPALKLRGCTPALVAFPAYTAAQAAAILKACLAQLPERCARGCMGCFGGEERESCWRCRAGVGPARAAPRRRDSGYAAVRWRAACRPAAASRRRSVRRHQPIPNASRAPRCPAHPLPRPPCGPLPPPPGS
jgi:hypothetical protein